MTELSGYIVSIEEYERAKAQWWDLMAAANLERDNYKNQVGKLQAEVERWKAEANKKSDVSKYNAGFADGEKSALADIDDAIRIIRKGGTIGDLDDEHRCYC